MPHKTTTQLKLSTHSTYSTRSHSIYLGYLQQKLLSIDYTLTPKVTITDWKENSELKLEIRKLNRGRYLVTLQGDSYYALYSNIEEVIFAVFTFIETNLLPKEKLKCQ